MDLTLLKTLRHKIVNDKVFSEAFEYFLDHFGEDTDFFDVGESANDDLLLELLGQIGGAIFKTDEIALVNVRLVFIKEYNFIHGGMLMNGAVTNVIYCTDLKKGIVVVFRPKENPPTRFARFSAEALPPNFNEKGFDLKH